RDALGNAYHIISDCRLYVSMDRSESATLPIDDERLKNRPWGPLYRFVHSQSCTLLCENREGWDGMWDVFQHFKLNDLSNSIRQEMNSRLTKNHLQAMIREKNRAEFQDFCRTLGPVCKADVLENLGKNSKKKQQKKVSVDSHASNTALNALETVVDVKSVNLKTRTPTPTAKQTQGPEKSSDEIVGKCYNFPQCPLKNKCKYYHPKIPCTKFPNCPRAWQCLFVHHPCPKDGQCAEVDCPYEHWKSMPTYYRKPRESETEKSPRPVASVAPVKREDSKQNMKKNTEQQKSSGTPSKQDGKKRCQFVPRCTKFHTDGYFHPSEKCKTLASTGKCAKGRRCLFLHGLCKKDGSCDDLQCIYEHLKSPPVFERILASKKGGLSRADSTSNLSTCTGASRGRRKSITFELDSDEEEKPLKKDSQSKKPKGILKNPEKNIAEICPFGSRCTQKNCEKAHPTEKCKAFPKCPNGAICMFLHETCKNDGVCKKENCDFVHKLPHIIENSWCRNGSRCRTAGCKFLHPEECIGRCPTPGDCWKYHRPGPSKTSPARQAQPPSPAQPSPCPAPTSHAQPPPVPPRRTTSQYQAANSGPGNNTGPKAGIHGAQLFAPHPPGAPYPYGPAYPMPGYGPGEYVPGFGAPGGFGAPSIYHGYPQGPGPNFGQGGPYAQYPGPNPAFTTNVALSPPPPYRNANPTREDREILDRKINESTRF
ncbi:hypothetical protein PMAYCL1PPCAC_27001, partial [Pristionchus mayeri]